GLLRRLEHLRVMGQAQVVVRADHDEMAAFDVDFGVFGTLDRDEVGIKTGGLELPHLTKRLRFREQVGAFRLECLHHASFLAKSVVPPQVRAGSSSSELAGWDHGGASPMSGPQAGFASLCGKAAFVNPCPRRPNRKADS